MYLSCSYLFVWLSVVGWGSIWGLNYLNFKWTAYFTTRQACCVITNALQSVNLSYYWLSEKASSRCVTQKPALPCDFPTFSLLAHLVSPLDSTWILLWTWRNCFWMFWAAIVRRIGLWRNIYSEIFFFIACVGYRSLVKWKIFATSNWNVSAPVNIAICFV